MKLFQTNFLRSIVALHVTVPSSTGPVGVIRCYSLSSSILDYHERLREISYVGA